MSRNSRDAWRYLAVVPYSNRSGRSRSSRALRSLPHGFRPASTMTSARPDHGAAARGWCVPQRMPHERRSDRDALTRRGSATTRPARTVGGLPLSPDRARPSRQARTSATASAKKSQSGSWDAVKKGGWGIARPSQPSARRSREWMAVGVGVMGREAYLPRDHAAVASDRVRSRWARVFR